MKYTGETSLRCFLVSGLCIAGLPSVSALENEASRQSPAKPTKIELAPTKHIYSPYIANQNRVAFGMQVLHVAKSSIDQVSPTRLALRMGGRLELFNWTGQANPLQQLQANIEVGFLGHFDVDRSQDNIGWEGNYGLLFSYRQSNAWAYRFGPYHYSSHIGDEYAERTGRRRISYTREEILLGTQYNPNPHLQYYFEAAFGYNHEEKPLQDRYRAQAGIQYQQTRFSVEERIGWYAGLDLTSYQENDWSINRALQIGFAFDAHPHTWRVAFDYYRGRSTIGEFFQDEEEYAGFGLYVDI